jgi:hypothetical protein
VQILYKTAESVVSVNTDSGNSRSELTDIDRKACNNIPEAVNKLAIINYQFLSDDIESA